ncbi:proline-rich acidic protein 1 isoform X2 [Mastomys coucha]|uniref:proline-rich acidic protein 1 isoform X2 n=1 Tax=Mastomys coucha TaxID=35658 RepID=UPI0012620886|nr:proline-rich acidic protein 1 isoform X2 [Mastomys coucha]
MKRFLLATCLVAALLWEAGAIPAHQETEKAWGTRAMEPLEKDNQLGPLLPVPKQKLAAAEEKRPDTMTWVETEDILSRLRNPLQGPELDLDSIDHPVSEDVQDEEVPQSWPILYRQVLQGPEEDLDHISHSMEDS